MSEAVNAPKETTEREVLSIDGKEYFLDSVTENGTKLIESIKIVDGEIQRLQLSTSIAGEAKNAIFGKLIAESANFEEVPTVETETEEAK
jgi:hypothetical protein